MSALSSCLPPCQKRVSYLDIDACNLSCDCLELNSVPLDKQPVLLSAESSLQPLMCVLTRGEYWYFKCEELKRKNR